MAGTSRIANGTDSGHCTAIEAEQLEQATRGLSDILADLRDMRTPAEQIADDIAALVRRVESLDDADPDRLRIARVCMEMAVRALTQTDASTIQAMSAALDWTDR